MPWPTATSAEAAAEWERIARGAALARRAGLEVHAGHGLDYATAEAIAGSARNRRTQHRPFPDRRGDLRRARRGRAQNARGDGPRQGRKHRYERRRTMILGIGSDITDIRRIAKVIERHGDRFIDRIFTAAERATRRAAAEPGGDLCQTLRRQGGLRQGAGNRPARAACGGAIWASSTCRLAVRPCN